LPRNNQRRTGAPKKEAAAAASTNSKSSVLDFVTPTEFVELPSGGRFYPEDHAFHNKETIEIRYMTAKDEDILTNQTLLRKGLALERLLENTLSNNDVDPSTLLVGDRNAIVVASRSTGYGPIYKTNVNCPSCLEKVKYSFDLTEAKIYNGDDHGDTDIQVTDSGTFLVELPLTQINVEMRLLNGADERALAADISEKKANVLDNPLTSQLRRLIVSLNGETDTKTIEQFVELMPAQDSRFLRETHAAVTPNIDLTQHFKCSACGHEQEMEVPFTVDFFWPNR
tara:strand:- start:777 stop:1625 length:849 start_codon:yes stop_codon:yes gene_type:complete